MNIEYPHTHVTIFTALSCSSAAITFQLDAARTAVRVTDHKRRVREIFLERGMLPGQGGGGNPLLDLWNNNYAVEIFIFAASSLNITNVLRYGGSEIGILSPVRARKPH